MTASDLTLALPVALASLAALLAPGFATFASFPRRSAKPYVWRVSKPRALLARLAARRLASRGGEPAAESDALLRRMTIPELRELQAILCAAYARAGAPAAAPLQESWLTLPERERREALYTAAAARPQEVTDGT